MNKNKIVPSRYTIKIDLRNLDSSFCALFNIEELKRFIRSGAGKRTGSDFMASRYHDRSRNSGNSFVHENRQAFPRNVSPGQKLHKLHVNANNGRKFR